MGFVGAMANMEHSLFLVAIPAHVNKLARRHLQACSRIYIDNVGMLLEL
jgi:hypothetical protein